MRLVKENPAQEKTKQNKIGIRNKKMDDKE